MAYESEIKYVVRDYAELETLLQPFNWQDIEQGYLTPNDRVRRIIHPNGAQQYFFTYKQRLPDGRNLEIEPAISAADFETAWGHTIERIAKRRVSIVDGDLKWDIDFYRWSRGKYFVLAEVEMPQRMVRPNSILSALAPRIVYEVARDDDRFAARRLADEDHVRHVAQELGLL